jgi:trimethylguanosine synthase
LTTRLIYPFYFAVIAIDIDPDKIRMARHNARIYGVEDKIEFINGNFLEIAPTLEADVVFLSPPWGGPNYKKNKQFDMNAILKPIGGMGLYNIAARISQNVAYFLPRNVNMFQVKFT